MNGRKIEECSREVFGTWNSENKATAALGEGINWPEKERVQIEKVDETSLIQI